MEGLNLSNKPDGGLLPRVRGLNRTLSFGETWPIFHSSVDVMVQGHTKPPRLGPSNISATGMSPAGAITCALLFGSIFPGRHIGPILGKEV